MSETAKLINDACDAIERAAECKASVAVANLCFALGILNRALPTAENKGFVQDMIDQADHDLALARFVAGV